MITTLKRIAAHQKEIRQAIKTIRIKGFKSKKGQVYFRGYRIDLSATNPDHLSIAYSTLNQLPL